MSETEIKVYKDRWIVLLLFLFVNVTLQLLWISFASVRTQAVSYYNVGDPLLIDLFALSFMIMYIPFTFVSAWVIDKYDFKVGAGIGVIIIGVFGFLRFFAFRDYTLALIFQIAIAAGQPFILNAVTKLSANWFPESERTIATGISMLGQFLGIMLCMFITPLLVANNDLTAMLLIYGILALVSSALFIYFVKAKPPTPPSAEIKTEKVMMTEGLKQLFKNRQFQILFISFLIVLGVFNTILTLIEQIAAPRGQTAIAGILGGIILLGGIVGSLIFSALSDKYGKPRILMFTAILISTIGLYILSFAFEPVTLYLSCFMLGFGVLAAAPVALEFAVKTTKPVPEASSNGMLMMIGQVGGIILVLAFTDFPGDFLLALLIQAILLTIVLVLMFMIKEE